ncbi:hypothetical protein BH11PLA2_BH11PLA2_15010 [soil metagenome]
MAAFKLGLVLEALQMPARAAIDHAATLGVQGVQLEAGGDLHPDRLGDTGRREVRTRLIGCKLELAAMNVPLRRGLDIIDDQQQRLDHIKKMMALAFDLGSRVIVVPLPKLPADEETKRAVILHDSLLELGQHGDRTGVRIALECGLDAGDKVREYLDSFECGLAVTYDPANFLVNRHDAVKSLVHLGSRVAYVQARDARAETLSGGGKEVATGAGDLDWLVLAATLDSLDYRGFVCVDREEGPQRRLDIENSVKFLRRFAGVLNS